MTDNRPLARPADWDAYRALPEWEVTARLCRTARFRVHAASPEEARDRVERSGNGVRSLDDLYDPAGLDPSLQVISIEAV